MKGIFTSLLLMFAGFTFGQSNFEGTIKFDFEFMGEGIEGYEAMLPTGVHISVLKSDMLTEIKGGMAELMVGRTITKSKTGISYMIMDAEETIYVMDPEKMAVDNQVVSEKPDVTRESGTLTIAGYECQKYSVITQSDVGATLSSVWVTDQFILPKSKNSVAGMSGMLGMEGVPGTPLKVLTSEGGMTVSITASEINNVKPAKALFKLPKGYKMEDYTEEKMMQGY